MKEIIANLISNVSGMSQNQIIDLLEIPPTRDKGDLSLPCFKLSKLMKQSPVAIANNLATQFQALHLKDFRLDKVDAINGYLNFFYDRKLFIENVLQNELKTVLTSQKVNSEIPVVIEYSSPNIAKHFKLYHIRSTMIGQSLANIHEALGYDVKKMNHLGDWGTQFGKLMAAYKNWGTKEKVEKDPINELVTLYVKYHEVADLPKALEQKLEDLRLEKEQIKEIKNQFIKEHGLELEELTDGLIEELKKILDDFKYREKSEEELKIFHEKEQEILSQIPDAKAVSEILEKEARLWFKKLEDGDEEATFLWKWFKEESMKVFNELYKQLNVSFDYILGESFYSDKMQAVIDELKQKNLLEEDQGAQVVRLDNEGMIPCIIIKSDGTSIYATRDLAAAIYREETFHPGKMLYVVDKRQSLHFNQVFSVLGKMNRDIASVSEHVSFGIMKVNGETGSTRQGKGLLLDEVLAEAISKAKETIVTNKNSQVAPEDVDKVAKQIGIASIVFNDLKHHPSHDIDFVIEEALSFEGKTGPYLQYTNARIQSLLEKSRGYSKDNADRLNANDETIWDLVYHLNQYVNVLTESVKKNDPSQVARFLLELAQLFNRFYAKERVITENTAETNSKLLLCEKVSEYLKHGLSLLCIEAPSKL